MTNEVNRPEIPQQVFDPRQFRQISTLIRTMLWNDPAKLIEAHKRLFVEQGEPIVERLAQCPLPVRLNNRKKLSQEQIQNLGINIQEGEAEINIITNSMFRMYVYGDKTTGEEHVAVIKDLGNGENVPIRIHSSCLTAETFHASNCDCHEQMEMALNIAEKEGYGGVVWLHQEGRGNGLAAKARQLELMINENIDTVAAYEKLGYPSEHRDFTAASDILKDLGIKSVRLITNNPDKVLQIVNSGITVTGRIPCVIPPINGIVRKDLAAKRDRHGHMFDSDL